MTVKKLIELPGMKDEHIPMLEKMGIKSVRDMSKALEKEETVKDLVKNLPQIGPKTVAKWKDILAEGPAETAEAEPAKTGKKKDKVVKKEEPKKEPEVIPEDDEGYKPKAKPELNEEEVDQLAKRAIISGRRPAFKRQEWHRYSKLGEGWRRPKGIHSKMKRGLKRRGPGRGHRFPRSREGQRISPLRIQRGSGSQRGRPRVRRPQGGGGPHRRHSRHQEEARDTGQG